MLFNLNLDLLIEFTPSYYSDRGRSAKHQAQILRSLILFSILFNKTKAPSRRQKWEEA